MSSVTDNDYIAARGLTPVTVKGNPSKTHLKKEGTWAALCGKEPGKGGGTSRMKNRTGWYAYTKAVSWGRPLCEACAKAAEGLDTP